jgi:2-dehydro-3-deoxygluconokinase
VLDRCDVITIGETMALLRTDEAQVDRGTRYTLGFGGAESNVAIGLARLGVSVGWYSALGDDDFGGMIQRGLSEEGVSVAARVDPLRPTGMMVKSLSPGASRSVSYYRSSSAARDLGPADLDRIIWDGVSILHLSGILPALSESCRELWISVAQQAKSRGVAVSLDVNFRSALWSASEASETVSKIVSDVDFLFGDHDELSLLAGEGLGDYDLAASLRDLGAKEVVVKRGDRGAACMGEQGWSERAAHSVNVLDSVGAGDAFVAGYLSAALEGLNVDERLARAVLSGALACTHPGDWEGAPFRRDLETSMMGVAP